MAALLTPPHAACVSVPRSLKLRRQADIWQGALEGSRGPSNPSAPRTQQLPSLDWCADVQSCRFNQGTAVAAGWESARLQSLCRCQWISPKGAHFFFVVAHMLHGFPLVRHMPYSLLCSPDMRCCQRCSDLWFETKFIQRPGCQSLCLTGA